MSKKIQEKGLSPYFSKLATQMIMPSLAGNGLVPSPNSTPSQVCVRKIRKTFVVRSTTPNFADGFAVAMFPDLYRPGYISASAVSLVPSVPGAVTVKGSNKWINGGPTMKSGHIEAVGGSENVVAGMSSIADSGLTTRLGFTLTPLPATAYNIVLKNKSDVPVTVHTMYKITGGAWTILHTDTLASGNGASLRQGSLPTNTDAIAYVPFSDVPSGGHLESSFTLQSGQLVSSANQSLTAAFETFIIDNDIRTGRVISMSLLVRNTSPEIANGGNVCAGRVPNDFHPINDVFQNMSVLPENRRYQGPASTGAYVSWMPSQFDEFEIDNIDQKRITYRDAEYIISKIDGWAPPVGTVAFATIEFDWIVEFFPPNQIFEKVLTPPRTEDFELLFHVLLSMPASTCNPEHTKLLKDLLRKGGESLKSGLQFVDRNKTTINQVLSLLLKLAV